MKKIKGKSILLLDSANKSIDIYQLLNGEYVCVITDGLKSDIATEIPISDNKIHVFMDKLKNYPKALELACEVFFADMMEEPCGYDKSVWECLKRIYERNLSIINIEINKENKREHI